MRDVGEVGDRIVSTTSPEGEHGGQLLDLGSNAPIGGTLGWTTASIVLILLCCCCVCAPEMHLRPGCCARADPSLLILVPPSISKPPSISLSRWPSVHPVVRPPPSLSCLPPASSVLSPRRCTLRSGPTRSHAAPPITICEAQHPRHASIWKHVQLHGHLVSRQNTNTPPSYSARCPLRV